MFLAVWTVCPTAGLPQSADGARRHGKIQKLKHHSAFHHVLGGMSVVPSDAHWLGEATSANGNMSELGRAGETQEPSGRERTCELQANQSDQLGQFPWSLQLAGRVRIKQMNENSVASRSQCLR